MEGRGRPRLYDEIVRVARTLDPGEILTLDDEALPWQHIEEREVIREEQGEDACASWCEDVLRKRILNALNYGVRAKAPNTQWRVRSQVDGSFTVEIRIIGTRSYT